MEHMDLSYERGVARLTFKKGVIHSISTELLLELDSCLETLESDLETGAVILTGDNDKFFCIGFDLPSVVPMTPEEFRTFFTLFYDVSLRLYAFPKPILCALRGHATAGGCIFALCCDFRWMAEGRKLLGLNEMQLNVPVPYVADRLMARLCGDAHTRRLIYNGEFCAPEEALKLGLADRVLPDAELILQAQLTMENLAGRHAPALAYAKRLRTMEMLFALQAYKNEDIEKFVEFWYDPLARKGLEAALERFRKS